jgi:hypothetical protein
MKRHEWNAAKPMWAIGTIDSYGAIRGRWSNAGSVPFHSREDGGGRKWRYNIWAGEFCEVRTREELTEEEVNLILDWLDKKGFIFHSEE